MSDPLANVQGAVPCVEIPGRAVRKAVPGDLDACNAVCFAVHGFDRGGDLKDAIGAGTAMVVEHAGRITGYSTSTSFFGHAVGESDDDIKALISAAPAFDGPGILVPARSPLLRWCLEDGLRIGMGLSLVVRGEYREPKGAWFPSSWY